MFVNINVERGILQDSRSPKQNFIIFNILGFKTTTSAFFKYLPVRELVKLQREVMSAESALEQKRLARHNLLLACKIQSLPIILLSGNLNDISEVQVGHLSLRSVHHTLNVR